MSGWTWFALWYAVGFMACIGACYDDWVDGKDIPITAIPLVLFTSIFGPIFGIWLVNEYWKKKGTPVLIRGRKQKYGRGRDD